MSIERYKNIINAALEIQQLKIELSNQFDLLATNITARELKKRHFEPGITNDAIACLVSDKTIKVEASSYVKSKLFYKDVDINLHTYVDDPDGEQINKILRDLETNEIYNKV